MPRDVVIFKNDGDGLIDAHFNLCRAAEHSLIQHYVSDNVSKRYHALDVQRSLDRALFKLGVKMVVIQPEEYEQIKLLIEGPDLFAKAIDLQEKV